MDWKLKNTGLVHAAIVASVLLLYSKYPFGHTTSFVVQNETLNSLFISSASPQRAISTFDHKRTPFSHTISSNTSSVMATPLVLALSFNNKTTALELNDTLRTQMTSLPSSVMKMSSSKNMPAQESFRQGSSLVLGSEPSSSTVLIRTPAVAGGPFTTSTRSWRVTSGSPPDRRTVYHKMASPSSTLTKLSSSETVFLGPNKTFFAELRITNLNYSAELSNRSSSSFQTTASLVTKAIDVVMVSERYYLGCQVMSFREGSVIAIVEINMAPGSTNDPSIALDRLKTAVKSGRVGNLTVDETYFVGWVKKTPVAREKLLYGQLAGVVVIFFILVALILIVCLGKFADEPLFEERELFSAEMTARCTGTTGDNQDNQDNRDNKDDEWRYDPLFAWSHRKTFDSRL